MSTSATFASLIIRPTDTRSAGARQAAFLAVVHNHFAHRGELGGAIRSVRLHFEYESKKFQHQLVRVRLDLEDTEENWHAMRAIKETLKQRFDQIDIWITAHRIDIV